MKHLLCLVLLVIAPLASARGIDPKRLAPIEHPATYTLDAPYAYDKRVWGNVATWSVQPGTFTEAYRAGNGVYLVCPGRCVLMTMAKPKTKDKPFDSLTFEGGIFLPDDPNLGAKVFYHYSGGAPRIEPGSAQATTLLAVAPGQGTTAGAVGGALGISIVNALTAIADGTILFPSGAPFELELRKHLVKATPDASKDSSTQDASVAPLASSN